MTDTALRLSRDEREELVRAYLQVQQDLEVRGLLPKDRGTILTRYRWFWEMLGALHLGLLVAVTSIVFNFILINILFHLPPS